MSTQTTFKTVYRPITKVINSILPDQALDFSGRATTLRFTANQSAPFTTLVNAEHFFEGMPVIIHNEGTSDIILAAALMQSGVDHDIESGTTAVLTFLGSSNKFFDNGGSSYAKDIQENLTTAIGTQTSHRNDFVAHEHNGTDSVKVKAANLDTQGVTTPYHVLALNGSSVPTFMDVRTYVQSTVRYSNTDTTTNLGASSSWTEIPIMGTMERRDNNTYFVPVGNGIQVNFSGKLRVRAFVSVTSAVQNSQLDIALKKNSSVQPRVASAFIRVSSGAAEATCYISDEVEVTPGDVITVVSRQGGATGSITLWTSGSSYLEIEIPPALFAQGPEGIAGNPNWSFLTDFGAPSNLNGVDYDVYLNRTNSDLYRKESGTWILKTNIKGSQGDPGVSKHLLWAERVGTLNNNTEEWSFGGASSSGAGRGVTQMQAGKVTHLALETVTAGTGVTTVELMKNGVATGQSITLAETIAKGAIALITPLTYVAGDVLGFRTVLGGAAANAIVSALLVEDGLTPTPPEFVAPINYKHTASLSAGNITNQYVDLPHLALPLSIEAKMNRLCIHEGQDYTTSTAGGVTRITFANDIATGGEEAAVAGDILRFRYQY